MDFVTANVGVKASNLSTALPVRMEMSLIATRISNLLNRADGWMDRWMVEWMDGWTDGWLNGWTDGWMDGQMDG